jgi:hypothetical protein
MREKRMKKISLYISIIAAALLSVGCVQEDIEFASDCNEIAIDAIGGARRVAITSGENWIASTDNTWITISPANGRGCAECQIIIDSALMAEPRYGEVLIQNLATLEEKTISVTQDGFPYSIEIEEPDVRIENYKPLQDRRFSVTLTTNTDFDVVIPEGARWLSNKKYEGKLNRGIRPRRGERRFFHCHHRASHPDRFPPQGVCGHGYRAFGFRGR